MPNNNATEPRRYFPAAPLSISLQTRENVYTGPREANYFWRKVLQSKFDWSQPLKTLISEAGYARAQILVEIKGHVELSGSNDTHPYRQKFATAIVSGQGALSAALDAVVSNFKVSKKLIDAPGYVNSGNIIVLTEAIVKLAYVEEGEGGALHRADMVEITAADGETIVAANPPTTLAYATKSHNACFFKCLYYLIHDKKWFKSLGSVRNLKSSLGLPNEAACVSISKAFEFCDQHNIELKLRVYNGASFTDHVSRFHADRLDRYRYRNIAMILHEPMKHYMLYFSGRIAKDPDAPKGRKTVCTRCSMEIGLKDAADHYKAHEIADGETQHFVLTTPTPEREEGETFESYGKRYKQHFVTIIEEFVSDKISKSILWFAGPGGCGKSKVIKSFKKKHGKELDIACISHTGVAAQNIGGRTIESYLSMFSGDETRIPLPDLLIIDEISMTSMRQFERINSSFCARNPENQLFGGVKVILMGDFCQLEIISTKERPEHSLLQSSLFLRYATPVPMLYGFRYKDDPNFFEFLCRMRENRVDFECFAKQNWKFCTRKQLAEEFSAETRPVFMSHTNAVVNDVLKYVHSWDVERSGRRLHPIPCEIYEVSLKSGPGLLEVPQSLNLSQFFSRKITHAFMRRTTTKPPTLFTKALVDTACQRGPWVKDGDCQVNTSVSEFYEGQRLLVTKNYCDRDRALMNGQEVTFVRVDNGELVVKPLDHDEERHIRMIWRGAFVAGKVYIARAFPVQSALAFTGHKAQGKTFVTAAVFLPKSVGVPVSNLYYVMLSRCTVSERLYFIFEDGVRGAREDLVARAYDLLFGASGRRPLVCYNKVATEVMEFTKRAEPMSTYKVDLENLTAEELSIRLFPSNSNLKVWQPSLPSPIGRREEDKFGYLLNDIIVYDIETGAADSAVRHPDFFDADGRYINSSNTARLTMSEWMVSFYHILGGTALMMTRHPKLRQFEKYQQPDGQVIFHRGEFEEDPSTDKWCSEMFFSYLMIWCTVKYDLVRVQSRKDEMPTYVVGFNIDSFDTKSLLQRFTDMTWPTGVTPYIIPNSGTAITQLQIRVEERVRTNKGIVTVKTPYIVTHDVFRLLGCIGSLDALHKSYVRAGYTLDKFLDLVKQHTKCENTQQLLTMAYEVGKGDLPHLYTQREGYSVTLSREVKTYRLEDYPEKDRAALQDPADRTFSFFDKSRSYMQRDLLTTLALYVAVNKMVMDALSRCCLVLNTAQQFTTTYFFHHYDSDRKSHVNSDGSVPVIRSNASYDGSRTTYKTAFFLLNANENEMVRNATYGGKTLPRVVEWNRTQGEGDYLQLDESGMYADRLQRCQYPYGRHHYSVSSEVCGLVMKLWSETLGNPERFRYPRNTSFPFMFVANVTMKMPSLCVDPGVAYKTETGELQWSICDAEGKEQGVRTQYLTNVDMATKMAEGAELLEVHEVLFWQKFGFVFESYLRTINTTKYTSSDPTQKNTAKLAANAFYGATLKTDHHTIFCVLDPNDPEKEDIDCNRIDWSEVHNYMVFPNGTIGVQAKALVEPNHHASRPNYTGAFVLAHSKYKLSQLVRIAHGPNFLPTTKQQVIDGLRFQCLYGDTDSLYIHSTHLERLLSYDDSQTEPTQKLLFDQPGEGDTPLTKLGRFCDEPSNDCGCGSLVDFRKGKFARVVRFASNAPKSYTVTYELPNGDTKFKSRLKGIKTVGSRLFVDEKTELDRHKRGMEVDQGEFPSKKARIEALINEETARRIELFDTSDVSYSKSSELTHNAMYTAITDPDAVLRTRCQGTLKNFGMFPQSHELDVGKDGTVDRRTPYDFTVANVQRDVCGDILTRRRKLTSREIEFLGLSEYDAGRILVPFGWNYDSALYNLV